MRVESQEDAFWLIAKKEKEKCFFNLNKKEE